MASASAPSKWSVFWATVTQFEAAKMNPWLGLRNAIGVALPLAGGIVAGQPVAGALMSTGALNVCFSDASDPYGQRARRMLTSCFLCAFSITVGALSGNSTPAAVFLTAVWGFTAGMMVAVGTAAADLGTVSLVSLVVFHARPMNLEDACLAGLAALCGGLLQTGLSLLFWPVRKYELERRELGKLYHELAAIPKAPVDGLDAPRASSQITSARQALALVARQHTLEADRCLSLLNQAERIRLSLLTLGRLKARMERAESGRAGAGVAEDVLSLATEVLESVSRVLANGLAVNADSDWRDKLDRLSEELRLGEEGTETPFLAAVFDSARYQTDALAGQLRAAADLAVSSTDKGRRALERIDRRKPWQLRLTGGLAGSAAVLRSNMNLQSAACRHAVRLATCVALGETIGRSLSWQRTYWLPMTVAIVLKPDFTATFSRGILRTAGTLAGLFLATLLFHLAPAGVGFEIVLVAVLTFLLRWAGQANYGILVAAVSALVVVLIAVSGVAPKDVIAARGVNSLAGGALALAAYFVWPTWQRTQIREMMAKMLDAYREYFRRVSRVYAQPALRDEDELDASRLAARLARSNVEASIDRMSAEPGLPPEALGAWAAMLASSHGMVNAMMAMEAALPRPDETPAPNEFAVFCRDVEIALHSVSSALRGSKILTRALPDLREDYLQMVEGGGFSSGRLALVAMECDRLTNRLNTLAELVVKWVSTHPVPITFTDR
jgi:uncharacterized membrane protein YccC